MGQPTVGDITAGDKDFRGSMRKFRHWLVNCGEWRPDGPRQRRIVETDNRQFSGNHDPSIMRNREDTGSHVIIGCENGRRSIGLVQQKPCAPGT